ncbi:MAG: DUF3560 domain-containing protein [Nostocales cyanobacterium W4_Combined_metabat2_030]|nr:DUF3560 domain-containing protein [Nostocales cyanobacterium W4_Combined_metabat2_030]
MNIFKQIDNFFLESQGGVSALGNSIVQPDGEDENGGLDGFSKKQSLTKGNDFLFAEDAEKAKQPKPASIRRKFIKKVVAKKSTHEIEAQQIEEIKNEILEIVEPQIEEIEEVEPTDNYYKVNSEGKMELYVGYENYKKLPDDVRNDIKRFFLFSRVKKAWISKGKDQYSTKKIADKAGLTFFGKDKRMSFTEELEKKKERAEYRLDRSDVKIEKAEKRATQLASEFNRLRKDWSWLTQPIIRGHKGSEAFARSKEKVFRDYDASFKELNKVEYYETRKKLAKDILTDSNLKSIKFVQNRIKDAEKAIRHIGKWVADYENRLASPDLSEERKDAIARGIQDGIDKLTYHHDKLAYYKLAEHDLISKNDENGDMVVFDRDSVKEIAKALKIVFKSNYNVIAHVTSSASFITAIVRPELPNEIRKGMAETIYPNQDWSNNDNVAIGNISTVYISAYPREWNKFLKKLGIDFRNINSKKKVAHGKVDDSLTTKSEVNSETIKTPRKKAQSILVKSAKRRNGRVKKNTQGSAVHAVKDAANSDIKVGEKLNRIDTFIEESKNAKNSAVTQGTLFGLSKFTDEEIVTEMLSGDLGEFLGGYDRQNYSIVLRGEKGAGKSRLLFQILNKFNEKGLDCALLSLEMHKKSSVTQGYKNEYFSDSAKKRIDVTNQSVTYDELSKICKMYDVVAIDSWTKLKNMLQTDFDRLQKENPTTIIIAIFQSTTGKVTRGGNMPEFDGGMVIQVNKGGNAECEKNRYAPIDKIYNVFTQRLEGSEGEEFTPGAVTELLLMNTNNPVKNVAGLGDTTIVSEGFEVM